MYISILNYSNIRRKEHEKLEKYQGLREDVEGVSVIKFRSKAHLVHYGVSLPCEYKYAAMQNVQSKLLHLSSKKLLPG